MKKYSENISYGFIYGAVCSKKQILEIRFFNITYLWWLQSFEFRELFSPVALYPQQFLPFSDFASWSELVKGTFSLTTRHRYVLSLRCTVQGKYFLMKLIFYQMVILLLVVQKNKISKTISLYWTSMSAMCFHELTCLIWPHSPILSWSPPQ